MASIEPDRASLEIVHSKYSFTSPLDQMLKTPAQAGVLRILARDHMERRARIDLKKLQANDWDAS